ncbi:unnamed protein product, partial [marine sediment metagenome]
MSHGDIKPWRGERCSSETFYVGCPTHPPITMPTEKSILYFEKVGEENTE